MNTEITGSKAGRRSTPSKKMELYGITKEAIRKKSLKFSKPVEKEPPSENWKDHYDDIVAMVYIAAEEGLYRYEHSLEDETYATYEHILSSLRRHFYDLIIFRLDHKQTLILEWGKSNY